ncbi:MAG: PRC-barrel domain-containing protein [Anaerolineae bacterium]|nr:PRC-barrel domain-containing protein [Anaerolineae bacterium]
MQFKNGTNVFTANGKEVGHIDRVVIDPRSQHVTHVVVRAGFLFTEDKLVPVELIKSADDDRVTLQSAAGDLDDLRPFEETHYVSLDDEEVKAMNYPVGGEYIPPVYGYPPYGGIWPGYPGAPGYSGPAGIARPEQVYATRKDENIPEGTSALREGARVISSDDKHVGEIESVLVDEHTEQATHFVISQGLFFKDHKLIPAHWVRTIGENEVYLGVGSKTLEQLPDYQPEHQ